MRRIAAAGIRSSRFQLAAVFASYFTSFFVLNSLYVALPTIAADLGGMPFYGWAISMPALLSAIGTLIFGKLSDMYGRRVLLVASTGSIFIGASICLLSHSFAVLIVGLSIPSWARGRFRLCASPPLPREGILEFSYRNAR